MCSKIFFSNIPTLHWNLFFQPLPILFFVSSIIFIGLIWLVWKKRNRQDFLIGPKELGATDKSLKLFFGWVPVILAIHLTLTLIVNGVQGRLFSYSVEGSISNWIGLSEIMIGLSLFYGGFARISAIFMGFLWISCIYFFDFRYILESIQYAGFACFFYLAGRGPYSIDRMLFPNLEPIPKFISKALLLLRISIGLNLIVFGFIFKFANIPYAILLSKDYAFLNFIGISSDIFVLIAGTVEIVAGGLIVLGIFPRTIALITLICINASLTISNWNELINYFPMYGALAVLLVWEPNNPKQKLIWVEALRKDMPERN